MFSIKDSVYIFLATAFVFLAVFGYAFFTSLILQGIGNVEVSSHFATYPYRGLMFFLSIFLLLTKPRKNFAKSPNKVSKEFVVFMVIYFLRILFDIYVRGVYLQPSFKKVVIQYMFVVMVPVLLAAYKSAKYVDLHRLNKWLCIGGAIYLLITINVSESLLMIDYTEEERVDGNMALNTIGFGALAASIALIFLCRMQQGNNKRIINFLLLIGFLVSVVIMLRAGSRGPLVSFISSLLIYIYSRLKNPFIGLIIASFCVLLIALNVDSIMLFISKISPVMGDRMTSTLVNGNTSGRDMLYANAWDIFLQNPILGKQFVPDVGIYSHNMFLDALIGLGIGGAIILLYFSIKCLSKTVLAGRNNDALIFVGMLVTRGIIGNNFSGAFYLSDTLCVLMIVLLSFQVPSDLAQAEVDGIDKLIVVKHERINLNSYHKY